MTAIILGIIGIILAPVLGGLIAGLDRKVTARMQSRFGPPILQPFYDVFKLFGKEAAIVNFWQVFCAYVYVASAAISVGLLFAGADLLLLFFVQAVGAVFLVFGALAAPSPYSQVGAHRELLQILAYEPLIILVFVGFYLATGSFKVADIFATSRPLLLEIEIVEPMRAFARLLGRDLDFLDILCRLTEMPIEVGDTFVITSYSIHYTKLYEFLR